MPPLNLNYVQRPRSHSVFTGIALSATLSCGWMLWNISIIIKPNDILSPSLSIPDHDECKLTASDHRQKKTGRERKRDNYLLNLAFKFWLFERIVVVDQFKKRHCRYVDVFHRKTVSHSVPLSRLPSPEETYARNERQVKTEKERKRERREKKNEGKNGPKRCKCKLIAPWLALFMRSTFAVLSWSIDRWIVGLSVQYLTELDPSFLLVLRACTSLPACTYVRVDASR